MCHNRVQFFTISFLRDLFNFVNSYTLLNNFEKLINNSVYKLFFFRRYYLLTKDKNKKLPGWNQRILFIHTRFLGTNFLQLFNLYLLYHSRCFPFCVWSPHHTGMTFWFGWWIFLKRYVKWSSLIFWSSTDNSILGRPTLFFIGLVIFILGFSSTQNYISLLHSAS